MNLDNRLAGKVVLVTGGGSGLGKGACQRIAAEGAAVAVVDIRESIAKETAAEIQADGGRAIAIACDVSDEAQVAAATEQCVGELGGLHGLFANAGTAGLGWLHELSLEDWNFVLKVNLTGPFLCCKHAIPFMLESGGGSIVITSSIAGSVIGAGGSAVSYAVSKAGVIQLARQVAVDYGPQGIRANVIQPAGVQDSNMGKHTTEDRVHQNSPPARMKRGRPWMALPRQGHPRDEYGATVAFLLSDDAGFVTGAAVPVDGGYLSS